MSHGSNSLGLGPSQLLQWMAFFAVDRDRPGVFVSTFLFIKGWRERDIGFVIFLKAIVALIAQPLMGDVVDKTRYKREFAVGSNVVVSLTGLSFVVFLVYEWVMVALVLQGIALTIMIPALYSLTLGTVGRESLHSQTAQNEYYSHIGTAIYALIAGGCSLYGDINWVYYAVALMGAVCCGLALSIRPEAIDADGARGLHTDDRGVQAAPKEYNQIFRDYRVVVFLSTILLFHLSNAAMLPLLSQLQSKGNFEAGIMITAVNIILSQVTQAVVALMVGEKVKHYGSKVLFTGALFILPIRGLIIVCVLRYSSDATSTYMLTATQLLDGVSHGVYSVVHVLITESLMQGTGRFSLLLGAAQTGHYVGDAISNLFGEYVAGRYGYLAAFQALGAISVVPVLVFSVFMPSDRTVNGSLFIDDYDVDSDSSPADLKSRAEDAVNPVHMLTLSSADNSQRNPFLKENEV